MTKFQLMLVSLIAAVPGGVLTYLLVMSFLSFADKSPGAMKGIAGVTLVLSGLLAAMPVGVMLFFKTDAEAAAATIHKVEKKKKAQDDEDEDVAEVDDEDTVATEDDDVEATAEVDDEEEVLEVDAEGLETVDEMPTADVTDEFEFDPDVSLDEEEEAKPAKKKKK